MVGSSGKDSAQERDAAQKKAFLAASAAASRTAPLEFHDIVLPPKRPVEDIAAHAEKAWAFFRDTLGSPRFMMAPMVDQSEIPFRLLCRRYGTDLAYTPMLHSRMMAEDAKWAKMTIDELVGDDPADRPLVVQFCGHDPEKLLTAAKMVVGKCEAVDINFGCPQRIAKTGRYGSFLLPHTDIVFGLINHLHHNLEIPVFAKIRLLPDADDPRKPDIEATMKLVHEIERAGAWLLGVHGRTRRNKGHTVTPADWDAIRRIREELSIPVVANGNISTLEDAERCIEYTGCAGVMSAWGILDNPAIFSGDNTPAMRFKVALEYVDEAEKIKAGPKYVRPHLFHMLSEWLPVHYDLRNKLGETGASDSFHDNVRVIIRELQHRVLNNVAGPEQVVKEVQEDVEVDLSESMDIFV